MKKTLSLLVLFFLLFSQNNAFAIVCKNTDTVLQSSAIAPVITQNAPKSSFWQRQMRRILTIKQSFENIQKEEKKESQGDKLADIGLKCMGTGVALSILPILIFRSSFLGSFNILFAILSKLAPIAILVGLILIIVALTSNDLTPEGKKKAKIALGLLGVLLLGYLILLAIFL
jgi:hypothetical protein